MFGPERITYAKEISLMRYFIWVHNDTPWNLTEEITHRKLNYSQPWSFIKYKLCAFNGCIMGKHSMGEVSSHSYISMLRNTAFDAAVKGTARWLKWKVATLFTVHLPIYLWTFAASLYNLIGSYPPSSPPQETSCKRPCSCSFGMTQDEFTFHNDNICFNMMNHHRSPSNLF